MYYIDTPTRAVTAYDFNSQTGDISNPSTVIEIPKELGAPDGMTIDSEGMLWVALWGGFGVVRIDPESGSILSKVDVPAPQVTSCTFGGDSLDTLYITTARVGMHEDKLAEFPSSGNIFAVNPGVNGLPVTPFKL
jgi:sugar lactone lactonase YvrE